MSRNFLSFIHCDQGEVIDAACIVLAHPLAHCRMFPHVLREPSKINRLFIPSPFASYFVEVMQDKRYPKFTWFVCMFSLSPPLKPCDRLDSFCISP
jgi:hypothetical protein